MNASLKSIGDGGDGVANDDNDVHYDPHYKPFIELSNEEEKLFAERAVLFRWDATNKEWKERDNIPKRNCNDIIESNIVTATEITKDSNFEYEEEWDIGGIPELLNDLDADIEKSLKVDHNTQTSCSEGDKNIEFSKKEFLKIIPKQDIKNNNLKELENKSSLVLSETTTSITKSLTLNNISSSKFAGFSKGGHLISTVSPHSNFPYSEIKSSGIVDCKTKLDTLKHLKTNGCTTSMSSQAGTNSNSSSTASGGGISNITVGQSGSSTTTKSTNKMSIDHQATLDKGLKMKIKRTKPGSKSSEAKHEIVKASEQQQNGLTRADVCISNQDEITNLVTSSNSASSNSTQNSNNIIGNNSLQSSNNSISSKKNVGNCINQTSGNISTSNNNGNNAGNSAGTSNNTSQSTQQGTKRGSSGHRRDKTKDKSSHSNRIGGVEKNTIINNEKELTEKLICHCSNGDDNTPCSNNLCIRTTESTTLTQHAVNSNNNNAAIPPGVFTPSTEISSAAVSDSTLLTNTASSAPIISHSPSNGGGTNTPGLATKDVSGSGGNIKISSHIAAQLAAVAASNGSNSSVATLSNTDLKLSPSNAANQITKHLTPGLISATVHHKQSVPASTNKANVLSNSISLPAQMCSSNSTPCTSADESLESPPAKRAKHSDCKIETGTSVVNNKDMVDICVGTSVGTITEPDCLGPCEPGTSVTLEGIVWHETEGGVLVVNVTWRGKTYVGTLLDCTRHDWAPPRFCDSPTEDLDSRTPKGRGKRGRATITPDLSNFTETRSSIYFSHSHVHSKLRNGATKGGRGTSRTSSVPAVDKTNSGSSLSSGNGESTPSTSPTAFLPPRTEKRKSKDEISSPLSGDNDTVNINVVNASGIPTSATAGSITTQPQSLINPVTGLNVQISTKKCKIASPCAISPVLLECPEQDCSKKYKHANGLRYHQSHAHGSSTLLEEDILTENEENSLTPLPSPIPAAPIQTATTSSPDLVSCETTVASKPSVVQDSEEHNKKLTTSDKDVSSFQTERTDPTSPIHDVTQSLPCDVLLIPTSTKSSNTISASCLTPAGGSITAGTSHLGQQKQFVDLGNNNININPLLSLETTNQSTQKSPSRVLRYGQGGELSLLTPSQSTTNIHNIEVPLLQPSSLESAQNLLRPLTPVDDINACQLTNSESYNKSEESAEKTIQPAHNKQISATLNQTSSVSATGKQKKNRKSPAPDYDTCEMNSCNISSREDVQSPAYSDISDDSTPVNEQDIIDKQHLSKNSDINKKSQELGLHSVLPSTGSQHNSMASTLGGYGVYQFYQQQQFMVPPPLEQQPPKHSLITNISQTVLPTSCAQHQTQMISEFINKKEPPLDLITKTSLSQPHSVQQDVNKESTRQLSGSSGQGSNELSSLSSMSSGALSSTPPSKPVSHFYAFNYMSPNYPFNVDPNYGPVPVTNTEDETKLNRQHSNDQLPQQHPSVLYKDDRSKDAICTNDAVKAVHQQILSNKAIKSEPLLKSENIKQEPTNTTSSQIQQQVPLHNKDLQGMGVFSNIYQRHPLTITPQQLSREEELRRYYIFSDQQRRQNSVTQQGQGSSLQSTHQQCKDDIGTLQLQHPQQIKIKSNSSLNIINVSGKSATVAKESPKHNKQEDEIKVIKQEGQKPTMETQGPPPAPTSQYFLHPSYIASAPFGFDPTHPMYRNVLMPATSPYNTPPYHLPIPRYHAPEDLSRNTGTKALDALHHAASQYYTTHKIHELSERALKSPNSSSSNSGSGSIKVSGSSPNIGGSPLSNISSNIVGHHPVSNQSSGTSQLPHNLTSQSIGPVSNKQDISGQKPHVNNSGVQGTSINEPKSQGNVNPSIGLNSSGNTNNSGNISGGSATDSRSPPPQRHVHTHHHTHVGLGYPMYPAPYGAAVLASQQAAAVAVINPFPPGPNK